MSFVLVFIIKRLLLRWSLSTLFISLIESSVGAILFPFCILRITLCGSTFLTIAKFCIDVTIFSAMRLLIPLSMVQLACSCLVVLNHLRLYLEVHFILGSCLSAKFGINRMLENTYFYL